MYIAMLRYGKKNMATPLDREVILAEISGRYPDWDANHIDLMIVKVFEQQTHATEPTRYILSLDAYFHLLEHDELSEARKSSRTATWLAPAAMVISGSLAAYSIWFDNDPVRIDPNQIAELTQLRER